jgi:hypothetical protein
MIVSEFKSLNDLNDYLARCKGKINIIPLSRSFVNPNNNVLVSTITYVVIEGEYNV